MIHIGICDDDRISISNINSMLQNDMKEEYAVTAFSSGEELEAYLQNKGCSEFHILFLDINLITQNGIRLAEKMKLQFPGVKIIFISGNVLYCQDIFGVHPTSFLLKPIQEDKLQAALELALSEIHLCGEQRVIALQAKNQIRKIPEADILYIESKLRKICFVTKTENIFVYGKLSEIIEPLSDRFLRCHNSYVVNLDAVEALEKNKLLLVDDRTINVSQAYYKKVKEAFVNYLGGLL